MTEITSSSPSDLTIAEEAAAPTENSTQSKSKEYNVNAEIDPDIGAIKEGQTKTMEHTRSTMVLLFVLGFFAILFLCFTYAITVNASLSELKDTLVAVIGAISGLIGFIVGYYYKSSQEL